MSICRRVDRSGWRWKGARRQVWKSLGRSSLPVFAPEVEIKTPAPGRVSQPSPGAGFRGVTSACPSYCPSGSQSKCTYAGMAVTGPHWRFVVHGQRPADAETWRPPSVGGHSPAHLSHPHLPLVLSPVQAHVLGLAGLSASVRPLCHAAAGSGRAPAPSAREVVEGSRPGNQFTGGQCGVGANVAPVGAHGSRYRGDLGTVPDRLAAGTATRRRRFHAGPPPRGSRRRPPLFARAG